MPRIVPTALGAVLLLSACAAQSTGSSSTSSSGSASVSASGPAAASASAAPTCTPATLKTHSAGTLTVATDSPAYEPWFVDNKPANGKGFESAVAFAVGKQLGYTPAQVKWTHASFNSVIAPTPKAYDFDINEVSITPARAKAVDFSSGYYDVAQSVITLDKSRIAGATTVAGLQNAKLGAQQGTTSFDAIKNVIKPHRAASEYPTNDLAVQALKNGQIDGLVVDLPTGLYLTSAELTGAKIVGQLPVTGTPEQFGLVLGKGSPLTGCLTKAVDALRADGTLTALQQKWLTTSAGAPELK
ncbi:MAG TPA: ABC transporter substrate-binding protein [Jatrophihabitans sp.]|jgi:polar amino acid transport system substrate-binding protein|nr:ABC transporter substrate-binding protein [Jatrophihabitans sp.]